MKSENQSIQDTGSKVFASLMESLRSDPELGPRLKEVDEVEAEVAQVLSCVDLDIAFSPVLVAEGDSMDDAVDVAYKGADGRYVIENPFNIVPADQLKIMRARYLVTRGRAMQPQFDRIFRRGASA